jgi:hypothetical protein
LGGKGSGSGIGTGVGRGGGGMTGCFFGSGGFSGGGSIALGGVMTAGGGIGLGSAFGTGSGSGATFGVMLRWGAGGGSRGRVMGARYVTTCRTVCSTGADCSTNHSSAMCSTAVVTSAGLDRRWCGRFMSPCYQPSTRRLLDHIR